MNEKHYISKKPCKKCGGVVRYKSNSSCVPCLTEKIKNRDPEISRRSYYKNIEKRKEYASKPERAEARKEANRKWRANPKTPQEYDKEKWKNWDLQRRYGITLEDYNRMLSEQDNSCYVCGDTDTRALAVDHNHETGKVRKLLCKACNTTLGNVKEDKERLMKLIQYLEEHN